MGFVVSTAPTYVYQSPSGYIFRLRIPSDLKQVVGKVEFRYSLRAGALRIAKYRARCVASYIQQLFEKVRRNMSDFTPEKISELVKDYIKKVREDDEACQGQTALTTPGSVIVNGETVIHPTSSIPVDPRESLSSDLIHQIVVKYVRETLANDEKCRLLGGTMASRSITLDGLSLLEGSNMGEEEARSLLFSVTRWLQVPDYSLVYSLTAKLLNNAGVECAPESLSYQLLSRDLMKALQDVLNVRILRSKGDYSEPDEVLIPMLKRSPETIHSAPVSTPEDAPSVTFSEVQKHYLEEVEKAEGWTEKTTSENLSIFALFVRAMGDLPIDQINRKVMTDYKSILMKLPPNLNKGAKYKDKTLEEIIESRPEKTLTVNTLNKYLRRLSGLFNYAVRNGYMTSNPAEGMQIKNTKRADQERQSYTTEDLNKLFGTKEYKENNHKHSYGYWAPLIGLYTGCRLEEICQLHLDDLRQEEGVWVFDINDKEEKRLKNMSSERLVPIHPHLVKLGLIKHVEALKSNGEKRLFPELRQGRDGYGQTVSKWFQRYKVRCGMGKGKTFHSFRHTFITQLKHKQVETTMIHELDGHTIDSEFGRYGKRYTPDILLKEAIEKIDYGIEL